MWFTGMDHQAHDLLHDLLMLIGLLGTRALDNSNSLKNSTVAEKSCTALPPECSGLDNQKSI